MTDDARELMNKTWTRAIDGVNKIGYMDGVSKGQNDAFQLSFDRGFEQGIKFGFKLGFCYALASVQQSNLMLSDARRINCQICLGNTMQNNIVNLYNIQKENNDEYLQIVMKKSDMK